MAPNTVETPLDEEKGNSRGHVMLLPSLGHGHLIPFLHLAKKLAAAGLTVSFVTTFHHIASLQKKANGLDVHLLQMEVPQDHLTLGTLNSNSVKWHELPPILDANERLHGPFERFLEGFLQRRTPAKDLPRPVCIIADFLLGWASDVATKFGIPRVSFEASGMFAESVQQIVWDSLPRNFQRTGSGRYIVPDVPKQVCLTRLQMLPELSEATDANETHQFWVRQRRGNKKSWRTIVNTFCELESEFVEHFQKVNGTLRTIGPLLPPEAFQDRPHRIASPVELGFNTEEDKCLEWLDAQTPSSVLYISFGSENSISTAQIEELALGLEASHQKFLWVLRIPSDAGNRAQPFVSALDFLPEGFYGRITQKDQGLMVLGWAPQLAILAHPSTGGFLSHCGWNAVLEATTMGVPLIAWPLYAEQHFNSKFVVDEIKIAVEAPQRPEEGWLVRREDIHRVVNLLMEEERSRELRKKVTQLKTAARTAVAEGGSSYNNFDLFVTEILSLQKSQCKQG